MPKNQAENPLTYKIDVLEKLKQQGYSSYRIRQEKILSESTLTKLRNNEGISWENLSTICQLLNCQPGDIIEFVPEKNNEAPDVTGSA